MDESLNDEIELITSENESQPTSSTDPQALINPSILLTQGSISEESINPASVHALQTAFGSLQKKFNEKSVKYNELQQRNKIMQKALTNLDGPGSLKTHREMEEVYANDPTVPQAAGAGGTSEDESVIAESRARQGYISHLEREILRSNTSIARGNEEIHRLKKKIEESDKEKRNILQNEERLHLDLGTLSDALAEAREENDRKDIEISHLNEASPSENQLKITISNISQENLVMRDKLEVNEKTIKNKSLEIQNLKSRLATADNELKNVTKDYRELENRLQSKQQEVSVLEAKCKQYEIEVKIGRENSLKVSVDQDDVDGDIGALTKALGMIKEQRNEIFGMKTQINQQQKMFQNMTTTSKGHSYSTSYLNNDFQESRPTATGASFHQQFELKDDQPLRQNNGYSNSSTIQMQNHTKPVITRRASERSDIRDRETVIGAPHNSPRAAEGLSPRVDGSVKLTGDKNVTEMRATAVRSPVIRNVASMNVFDSKFQSSLSPKEVSPVRQHERSKSSSPQTEQLRHGSGEYYNTSPRNRNDAPFPNSPINIMPTPIPSQPNYKDTGARPRVQSNGSAPNYLNLQYNEPKPPTLNQIPDRMTQSAIIRRDEMPMNDMSAMSRSVFSPLVLNTAPAQKVRSSEHVCLSPTPAMPLPNKQRQRPMYVNDTNTEHKEEPDYENIYNVKVQTDIKRPLDEHEEVFANDRSPNNASPVNFNNVDSRNNNTARRNATMELLNPDVSALKICPVCNEEFSRLTMDQFQTHVFECFDNVDESPATLQPLGADDDRNCPMCGDTFPAAVSQETFEQHVLGHFGEEPLIDTFEMVQQ